MARTHTRAVGYATKAGMLLVLMLAAAAASPAETITWTSTVDGDWNEAANWDPSDVPDEAGESAQVADDGGTYTITLDLSPTLDAVTLLNPLATLNLASQALTLLTSDGLINSGVVGAITGSATIDGRINNQASGQIETRNGRNLTIRADSLINEGTMTINSNAGSSISVLAFDGDVALAGSGELRLRTSGQTNDAEIHSGSGGVLTQLAAHEIRGAGTIDAALINYGTIMADESGHSLVLDTDAKTNHGIIGAVAGCYLNLADCTLTQVATGTLFGNEGTVRLEDGAVVVGGRFNSQGAGSVETTGGTVILEDVENDGSFGIVPGTVQLRGVQTTNDGTITLNPASSNYNSFLTFIEDVELAGNGTCVMVAANNLNDANITSSDGVTATQGASHTIRGAGTLSAALVNEGLIAADDPARALLLTTNPKTNRGTLQGTNGAELTISGCEILQEGGTIAADGGTVGLAGHASITGGELASSSGGAFDAYGDVSLANLTQSGDYGVRGGAATTLTGSYLRNDGTIVVNSNDSGANAVVQAEADIELQGEGTLQMVTYNNQNDAALTTVGGATLTQAASHTIRGAGEIGAVLINEGLISADDGDWRLDLISNDKVNRGELRAENGGVLRIAGIHIEQQGSGQIVADAGVVQLNSASLSGGVLSTANEGAVCVRPSLSTLSGVANQGTLQIDENSQLAIHGPTFANEGLIDVNFDEEGQNAILRFDEVTTVTGSGEIRLRLGSTSTNDAQISTGTGGCVTFSAGQTIYGTGELLARMINEGTIVANDPATDLVCKSDSLVNRGVMRADQGGDLSITTGALFNEANLAAVDTSRVRVAGSGLLVNGGTAAATGEGTLAVDGGQLRNEGTIEIGAGGHFDVTGGTVINTATVSALAGGAIWVDSGTYQSQGLTDVRAGGSFWSDRLDDSGHYGLGTLTGGTWQIAAGGSMRWIDCNISTLAGGIVLIGPGATIHSDEGTTDALAGLDRIETGGRLELHSGRDFTTAGELTNWRGDVVVGAGCRLAVQGEYAQSGNGEIDLGRLHVDGTFAASIETLAILGGTLGGSGTIENSVASSGWVKPGASIGTLSLTGDFTQASTGTYDVQLGGTGVGESDLLQVGGQATLDGRLVVRSIDGYEPQIGDHFTILACGSRSGQFAIETGAPGLGLIYQTTYYEDRVEIEILGDPSGIPEITDDPTLPGEETDFSESDAPAEEGGDLISMPGDGGEQVQVAAPTEVLLSARMRHGGDAAVRLALPRPAQVELVVYDLNGRQVATIATGEVAAGWNEYHWRGAAQTGHALPSGVYLMAARVRMASENVVRTTRVLLLH